MINMEFVIKLMLSQPKFYNLIYSKDVTKKETQIEGLNKWAIPVLLLMVFQVLKALIIVLAMGIIII